VELEANDLACKKNLLGFDQIVEQIDRGPQATEMIDRNAVSSSFT